MRKVCLLALPLLLASLIVPALAQSPSEPAALPTAATIPAAAAMQEVVIDLRGLSSDKSTMVLDAAIEKLKVIDAQDGQIPEQARAAASSDKEVVRLMEEASRLDETLRGISATPRPEAPAERGEFETRQDYDNRIADYERRKKEYEQAGPLARKTADDIRRIWDAARAKYDDVYYQTINRLSPVRTYRVLVDAKIGRFDIDNMRFNVFPTGFYGKPGTVKIRQATPMDRLAAGENGEVVDKFLDPDQVGVTIDANKNFDMMVKTNRIEVSGFNSVDQARKFKNVFQSGGAWLALSVTSAQRPTITYTFTAGKPGREGWKSGGLPFKEDPVLACHHYKIDWPSEPQTKVALVTNVADDFKSLKYIMVESRDFIGQYDRQATASAEPTTTAGGDMTASQRSQVAQGLLPTVESIEAAPGVAKLDCQTIIEQYPDTDAAAIARDEILAIVLLQKAADSVSSSEKVAAWEEVVRKYPNTNSAKVAKSKLEQK